MKKKKALLIGAALLLGAMAPARAEILVGFVTGLSGPVSSIGVPNAKGLAAGQAYIGEIDGEKVRVIQLDDGSDPAASTRNARKLVEQEKVDFLIGTSGAPQTLAMATAAIEMKVPMWRSRRLHRCRPERAGHGWCRRHSRRRFWFRASLIT